MTSTISIPVSFLLFPITVPIALVRLVVALVKLAVASVVAVIISPISFVAFICDESVGYTRKYTILETKQMRDDGKYDNFTVYKLRVRPGIIPFIAGAKSKIVKVWEPIGPNRENYNFGHIKHFLEDGTKAPQHLITGIENTLKANEERKLQLKHLKNIRNAVEITLPLPLPPALSERP